MKMMGRKSKGLLFSMGMYAVILTEAAACQCLAEDIPADIPNVKIEYVPLRAADHIEMVQRIHATDNEQAAESGLLFSKEDTETLQRIAMAEAGNQGPDGMWMVMSVVLNRVESEDFPNTIKGVILQSHQFSSVTNKSYYKVEISDECIEAYQRICTGEICPEIIGFERKDSHVLKKYFQEAFTFKDHTFFTAK